MQIQKNIKNISGYEVCFTCPGANKKKYISGFKH